MEYPGYIKESTQDFPYQVYTDSERFSDYLKLVRQQKNRLTIKLLCDLTNKKNGQEVVKIVNKKHAKILNFSRLMLYEKDIKSTKFKLFWIEVSENYENNKSIINIQNDSFVFKSICRFGMY